MHEFHGEYARDAPVCMKAAEAQLPMKVANICHVKANALVQEHKRLPPVVKDEEVKTLYRSLTRRALKVGRSNVQLDEYKEKAGKERQGHSLLDLFSSMEIVGSEYLPSPDDLRKKPKEVKVRSFDAPTAASSRKVAASKSSPSCSTASYYERMKRQSHPDGPQSIPEDFLNSLSRNVDHLLQTSMQIPQAGRREVGIHGPESSQDLKFDVTRLPAAPAAVGEPAALSSPDVAVVPGATAVWTSPPQTPGSPTAKSSLMNASKMQQTAARQEPLHGSASSSSPPRTPGRRSYGIAPVQTPAKEPVALASVPHLMFTQPEVHGGHGMMSPMASLGDERSSMTSQKGQSTTPKAKASIERRATTLHSATQLGVTTVTESYRSKAAEMSVSADIPDPASLLPPGGDPNLIYRTKNTLFDNLVGLQEATLAVLSDSLKGKGRHHDGDGEADTTASSGSHEDCSVRQAIWRLRKYLRRRFGGPSSAWDALEAAARTVNKHDPFVMPRMEKTLTTAEVKIGLSRLGIKLPAVAGYSKIRDLLNAIDEDRSGYITYEELLGDDDADPSLVYHAPPPKREAWKLDVERPKWNGEMRLDSGMFDHTLRQTVCQRDVHFEKRPQTFKPMVRSRSEERPPLWQRSVTEHRENMAQREEWKAAKEKKEKDECTFQPHRAARARYSSCDSAGTRRAYSRRVTEENETQREKEMRHLTFKPEVNMKSRSLTRVISMVDDSWHDRLSQPHSESDERNRMGRLATSMHSEREAEIHEKPNVKTRKYELCHQLEGSAHDRLFHHFANEYWKTDQALQIRYDDHTHDSEGAHDAERNRRTTLSSAPEALRKRWAHLTRLNGYEMQIKKMTPTQRSPASTPSTRTPTWTPSSVEFPGHVEAGSPSSTGFARSRSAPPERGQLTLAYRPALTRMVQAINRYGKVQEFKVDDISEHEDEEDDMFFPTTKHESFPLRADASNLEASPSGDVLPTPDDEVDATERPPEKEEVQEEAPASSKEITSKAKGNKGNKDRPKGAKTSRDKSTKRQQHKGAVTTR